jgi:AcrR family transcriptional regulator
MNRGVEVRKTLMNSAIRVVSVQGIQNATTKALSIDSKLSEVYIYRHFKSKDDLLEQTFYALDKELMLVMKNSLKHLDMTQSVRSGFRNLFHDFWKFALGDRDKCSFFVQYYYSSNYLSHSDAERKAIYQPLLDAVSPAFVEGADPWTELNHMYDVAFAKLWRVIRGVLPDTIETEENVYSEISLIEERSLLLDNKVQGSL